MHQISEAITSGVLEEISEREKKERREEEVRQSHGKRAKVVHPYEPNRKQRRAQAAMERRHKERVR